jgi:hypothetical protein
VVGRWCNWIWKRKKKKGGSLKKQGKEKAKPKNINK